MPENTAKVILQLCTDNSLIDAIPTTCKPRVLTHALALMASGLVELAQTKQKSTVPLRIVFKRLLNAALSTPKGGTQNVGAMDTARSEMITALGEAII